MINHSINLFEHQSFEYSELGLHNNHPLIQAIDRLNKISGIEFIRPGYKSLKATQYVGVIRVGGTTLQILPKIDYERLGNSEAAVDSEPHKLAAQSATRNLLFMLSYTHNLKIREQDIASLTAQRSDWFEILTRLLAMDLHKLMQRGLIHQYIIQEELLPVMRGRLQIERQLTRHPQVKHRFDIIYDEFSPDILLNQIFRIAVEQLLIQTQNQFTRTLLLDIKDWLCNVSNISNLSSSHLNRIVFTRLNESYKPAFNLARMFLEHMTLQLLSGTLQTFAFLFDMNLLFETFVAQFLTKHRRYIFPEEWGQARIRTQSKGRPIFLAKKIPQEENVFQLIPDILVERPGRSILLILDTKYKELEPSQRKFGVSESDFYQMLVYSTRLDCSHNLLLYPQSAGMSPMRTRFDFWGGNGQVIAATLDLHKPLNKPAALIQEMKAILNNYSQVTA